ncbi:MAG: AmmeMemoRadiSam system protein B [Treponema sp.]|jgi:AmmeMemoRadiSam system protein B|nr:AmmeMemoRadiSam system protein B [Treponema sp.]
MNQMKIRESFLPAGWYPRDAAGIARFLEESRAGEGLPRAGAAIAPHAGWFFSGKIAAAAVSSLDREADTVAILGGHLAAASPILVAGEDAFRSPLGLMPMDGELRDAFTAALERKARCSGGIGWAPDRYRDNTVEALVPMVHFFFPRAKLLALRLPADSSSWETGALLSAGAAALGRKLAVLGSTDLTHYGANYGFFPQGRGEAALKWVREVNDRRFIQAVLAGDRAAVLERAEGELSACSAGAVLGAMGFAASPAQGEGPGKTSARDLVQGFTPRLLAYGTSADAEGTPDSFVGYGAIGFFPAGD